MKIVLFLWSEFLCVALTDVASFFAVQFMITFLAQIGFAHFMQTIEKWFRFYCSFDLCWSFTMGLYYTHLNFVHPQQCFLLTLKYQGADGLLKVI